MDRKQLNIALQALMSAHRLGRYQGLVISCESEAHLDIARVQLEGLCLDHDLWRHPGVGNAPNIPIPRRAFLDQVFNPRSQGLLVHKPGEWMINWSGADHGTFWNALADSFGRHEIIALAVRTPTLTKKLRISFVERRLCDLPVSVWLSRHQPLSHFKEVLQ